MKFNRLYFIIIILISLFELLTSCTSKNFTPITKKISFISSESQAPDLSSAVVSALPSTAAGPTDSVKTTSKTATKSKKQQNSSSSSSAGSDKFKLYNQNMSSIIFSAEVTQQNKKDIIKIFNDALLKESETQYICFNFTDTRSDNSKFKQTGYVIIQNNSQQDIFLTKITNTNDGLLKSRLIYCDGSKLYFQNTDNNGLQTLSSIDYNHSDFYKYINYNFFQLNDNDILSYNTEKINYSFECSVNKNYSNIFSFLNLSSQSATVTKITQSFSVKNQLFNICTQSYTVNCSGNSVTYTMQQSFFEPESGYKLLAPEFVKNIGR